MEKITKHLRWLLASLLLVTGMSSAWADEVTFTPGTDTGATSVTKSGVTATMTTMNNSSYYQIYANQSGTFSVSSGSITKIEFTCTASGTSKYGPGNASANVGSYSYSGNKGTWTGNASSVTISSTAQVRMSSLTITYSAGGSTAVATTTTIDATGITNTDVYVDTDAGFLSATVKDNNNAAVSGATVTWSSSKETVATIDEGGFVNLVAAGKTTITATYAGKDNAYLPSSTTYELTVTSSAPYVQPTEFEIAFNNDLFGTTYTGTASGITDDNPLVGTLNGVTVTYAGSGNHYVNNSQIRFYPNNKLTFEAPTGYNITKIEFTSAGTWAATISSDEGTYSSDTKTWEGEAATVLFTGSGTSRCDMSKVTITLKANTPKVLSSISLSGDYPTTFHVDDAFSHEGIVVTATYDNATTKDVTASATFTGYDMAAVGEQTVTVSYSEGEVTKTATYGITVNAPATLTSITLSGTYPTAFDQGDAFSSAGIVVTANFDDNTTSDVTSEAIFSGYDMSTLGEQTVTVSYGEKTTTYTITVNEKKGTADNPYTVAEARAAIDANTGTTGVYATGIVSKIVTAYSSQHGNISFNISSDGEESSDQLEAYRCVGINGVTSADDVKVGDIVVIYGNLTKYGSTYEFGQNCQLVSLTRPETGLSFPETSYEVNEGGTFTAPTLTNTTGTAATYASSRTDVATVDPSTGDITLAATGVTTITATAGTATANYKLFVNPVTSQTNAFTVAEAIAYIGRLGTETSPVDIYVSGIVSNAGLNGNYVVYYISDDGTDDTHLYVYGGKGLEGATLANGDVQQGDEVTVYGKLVNYNGNTPEFTSGNQIVAFNRPEKENPGLSFGETTEYTITVGDEFTEPTLINPNQLSVTYSGDNNQLAMVDEDTGELTFVEGATGTIVVTATFAGNTQYNAGTATYTLTVEEEPAVVITPNPKNINSEYYEKVTDMSELEDGDAIILVVENGTASQAMGTTTTNGAYRPSYGLASNGKYDWENSTVQLSDEGKADIEKIVLVKEGDLFYLYATRTATLTGFLYANNYGLYVDSNNTNLADNHKAAISIDATGNASITFQGDTTNPLFGRTSSGWSSFASGTTLDNMQIYVERSVSTPATGNYVKVESANDLTDGEYLIVYEDGSLAFDGSLETLDAVENTIGVTIGNKTIASSETVDAATFTIKATNNVYTIKSASGMYIGQTSDANGLQALDTALDNTIIIDTYGNADIISSGGAYLRYNATSGQERFRYFKSSTYTNQKAIALYKKQTAPIAVEAPVFDPAGGTYTEDKTVTITCATDGAAIYYTLDGTDPTTASTLYTDPVAITTTTTLKAIASDGTNTSTITEAKYTINKPTPTTTEAFVLVEDGTITEGDYLIVYDRGAMNTTVEGNRLQFAEVSPDYNNIISTNNASIIWHIAKSGSYYTIYNAAANAYAAGTEAKNNAQMLADGTSDKALWTVEATDGEKTFDFTNKANEAKGVNATLRRNGTFGFACYSTITGDPLSLYKKVSTVSIDLIAAQDNYKTMVAPYDMVVPNISDGIKAYIVTLNSEQTEADLEPIVNIPAGTPIILHANSAGSYELEKAGTDFTADDVSENVLLVSNGEIEGDGTIFVLNNVSGIGFYPLNEGKTLACGKCYLTIKNSSGVKFIGFNVDDVATGIETVESTRYKVQGTIYDLQGRRVTTPAHGLYIVNGKKVFIK